VTGLKIYPPGTCFAVFASVRTETDNGYYETNDTLFAYLNAMPGFVGYESARGSDRLGITVAYFDSEEAIREFRGYEPHRDAQKRGREEWYETYSIHVGQVSRSYGFPR
jgi:heme-degrading monooxygenase HmoA